MIIECPSCNSRYRIREDKLPAEGGNIKCPNCAHVFFVPRDGAAETQQGKPAASTTDATPAVEPVSEPASPEASAAEPGSPSGEATPIRAPSSEQRWKLRNSVGLVYDFPGIEQLRRWLSGRDSFDGLTVSADDGETWTDVSDVSELDGVQPTGRKQPAPLPPASRTGQFAAPRAAGSGSFSGTGSLTNREDIRREAQARVEAARNQRQSQIIDADEAKTKAEYKLIKPPSNAQEEKTGRVLLLLAVIILPIVAMIGLHTVGVIDLSEYGILPPREPDPVEQPVVDAAPTEGSGGRQLVELTSEQAANLLITQASGAVSRGDTAQAIEFLERALALDPTDTELHCQLAGLYQEVERSEDAEISRQQCEGANEPDEGSADAPDDAPSEEAPATP